MIFFSILSAVWNLHSRNHCSVFLSIDIPRGIRSYTHLMAFMMSYHLLLIDQASFSIKLRWVSRCGAKKAMQAAPRMLLACFQSLHVRRATICPFLQRLKECERCLGTHSEKIAAEEGDCFPHRRPQVKSNYHILPIGHKTSIQLIF